MIKLKILLNLSFNLILFLNLHHVSLGYNSNYNNNYQKYSYQNYANEYAYADPRYFKHGSRQNEVSGGTCNEFLRINSLNKCCNQRDDDCYMIHYDTRCYCDVFCDRSRLQDNSDCCDDAVKTCSGIPEETTPRTTTYPVPSQCYHEGVYYEDGQIFQDNCNECRCLNGRLDCSSNSCLINKDLLYTINNRNSWQASNYSMFWGKTLDYGYKNRLGTKIPNREQRALEVDDKPIKEFYDYRNEPFMVNNPRKNNIRDQGNCGASWAFSTLDVATDRTAKVYEGKRGNESASVQMLISCAILPENANGCSPAPVDVAWRFIENKEINGRTSGGLVSEKCYPYESATSGKADECKVNANSLKINCPSDNKPYTDQLLNTGPAYPLNVETPNDIMEEIIKNGPVQVIFKVFEDFFMYKSGIYSKMPEAKLANVEDQYHSVKLLGWGSENGRDYWLAANSWGDQWGENGYFRIERNDDETEFGRHVYSGWGNRPVNTKNKNKNSNYRKRNRNIQRRE